MDGGGGRCCSLKRVDGHFQRDVPEFSWLSLGMWRVINVANRSIAEREVTRDRNHNWQMATVNLEWGEVQELRESEISQ